MKSFFLGFYWIMFFGVIQEPESDWKHTTEA